MRSGPRGGSPRPCLSFPRGARTGRPLPVPAPAPARCRPPPRRAMELIELRELQPEPRTGRGRLERTNALRISPARRPGPGALPDPRLTAAPGAGHRFEPRRRGLHTWCDLCGDFVWGGGRKSLQCRHCSFTCHYRCRALVRLDCSGPPGAGDEDDGTERALEKDTNVDEPSEWEKTELDQEQVEQRIKEYNSQINSNLFMSMNKDGSYTGFIKVQLKLVRPVSVPATKRAPSLRPGPRAQGVKRRTSFYLPKGTVKHLHILSHTRVSEVIDALLRKFTVVDNPRKFALFERSEKDEQVYLRKLGDDEQPLRLRLLAGPSEKVLSFVLKENETGEVNWDAFTLPELHNFLRILQREEEEHVRQLRHRYARCRQKMQEALATLTPG
ncbi:ras association domain-containing protein 1 isoform X2 [Cuculus canorus]|uniref:ras association domain-containing protein 1 isoform X2 n=1 Tax=Cuculus canorus TaxID=55661 RepID=UPI0023AA3972|nr:ras association domain-containing protein 1 isoform X2 [Cuculus canorus]